MLHVSISLHTDNLITSALPLFWDFSEMRYFTLTLNSLNQEASILVILQVEVSPKLSRFGYQFGGGGAGGHSSLSCIRVLCHKGMRRTFRWWGDLRMLLWSGLIARASYAGGGHWMSHQDMLAKVCLSLCFALLHWDFCLKVSHLVQLGPLPKISLRSRGEGTSGAGTRDGVVPGAGLVYSQPFSFFSTTQYFFCPCAPLPAFSIFPLLSFPPHLPSLTVYPLDSPCLIISLPLLLTHPSSSLFPLSVPSCFAFPPVSNPVLSSHSLKHTF